MTSPMDSNPPAKPSGRRPALRRTSDRSMRSVAGALQSSFARIDSFFNIDRTGDRGMSDDAESITTELRHLRDAEDELRRELDAIGGLSTSSLEQRNETKDHKTKNKIDDAVPSLVSPKTRRRDSFSSLKRQVSDESFRNLQCKLDDMFHSLDKGGDVDSLVGTALTETSNSPGSERDRPRRHRSIGFNSEGAAKESYSYSFIEQIANVVFGRCEYTVKPTFTLSRNAEPCTRTVQGGVVVALTCAILVSRLQRDAMVLPVLFIPLLVTWIEINSSHRWEETTIALGVLSIHFATTLAQ